MNVFQNVQMHLKKRINQNQSALRSHDAQVRAATGGASQHKEHQHRKKYH